MGRGETTIPFIGKAANDSTRVAVPAGLGAIVLSDLVVAFIRGDVVGGNALRLWMITHGPTAG